MTDRTLPHNPYITAVDDALTAAGLAPDWTQISDSETNRYDASGLTTQLDALLVWTGGHPAVNTEVHEDGLVLLWEHPAEQWQWAPRKAHGELEHEPEFLPTLGRYADPAAVVAVVRTLLAGEEVPEGHAPYWHEADAVKRAVAAWETAEQ
ncbi:hypothetical protein [Streptomyces sp. CC224B]|uniref:hypothetical protein n=1 Tax=Streptomyces sp. CC224B TaxID=3044571 RepID=UPI0024A7EC35|nr:hypothetical protein [Streptomyces sp. CC224B]